MKTTFLFLSVFLIQLNLIASDSTLVFKKIKYSQVFKIAKKEKKAVMLYFHFDGCGACMTMEKTAFKNNKVADFYNTNFVCMEVNALKGEGIETNKIYNVKSFPTFIFLDKNGKELHKIAGVFSPEEFVMQAKDAIDPINSLANLKLQYKQGKREEDFLLNYCYKLRDAGELDSLVINDYLNTQSLNDFNEEKNIKFIYEFAYHWHKPSFSTKSEVYKFMHTNMNLFKPYFELEQVVTRLMFIASHEVYSAIAKGDSIMFKEALESLKEFDTGILYNYKEMDGRITMWTTNTALVSFSEMSFYEKTNNIEKFNIALKQFLEKIWNDQDALNTFAWNYYEKYDDEVKLKKAVECVVRSIELNSNYPNNDTYANLLYKLNEYDKALEAANKAIEIAKSQNQDYGETSALIRKIEEKRKK